MYEFQSDSLTLTNYYKQFFTPSGQAHLFLCPKTSHHTWRTPHAPVRRPAEYPAIAFRKKSRVKHAALDVRQYPKWQRLDESCMYQGYQCTEELMEPWDVQQLEINGNGLCLHMAGG